MWIRTASKRDIPAVRALLVETWHATYDRIYGIERVDEITGEWYSETALVRNLARPEAEFLVADDGTKIAGMAFVAWDGVGEFKPDQQHLEKINLHQLYVLPDRQQGGVGQLLLDEVLTCFPQAHSCVLEVDPENSRAIRFYRRNGFEVTGETANCGREGSGIAALILSKKL